MFNYKRRLCVGYLYRHFQFSESVKQPWYGNGKQAGFGIWEKLLTTPEYVNIFFSEALGGIDPL